MRIKTIKFEKFIVSLTNNNPFELNEFVKVLRKSDFEKIGNMLKHYTEREQLKKEINELIITLKTQLNCINSLEKSSNNKPKNKDKTSILKDLIKI